MFLKNNRELAVKNGSLATVIEVTTRSIAVRLDAKEKLEVEFRLADYSALDYGYTATIHKAQGATAERTFVLATPGMDSHLAYVAMTRHREQAEIYDGHEDFRDFQALKQRLSRERMKDTTLDYAERRGLDGGDTDAGRDEAHTSECDPIARFKAAQHEFIRVAGRAGFDPAAETQAGALREEMKSASQEIAKNPAHARGGARGHRAPSQEFRLPGREGTLARQRSVPQAGRRVGAVALGKLAGLMTI